MSWIARSPHTRIALAVVALGALAAACGDDDDSSATGAGISSRQEWCDIVGQVDDLFSQTDSSSDPFEVKQEGYAEIVDLTDQLIAGLEHTDPDAAADLEVTVQFAADVAGAFVEADDVSQAEQALEPIFAGAPNQELPGAVWISENCGVDIDG